IHRQRLDTAPVGCLCAFAIACSKAAHHTRTIARATLHATAYLNKAVSSIYDVSAVAVVAVRPAMVSIRRTLWGYPARGICCGGAPDVPV
ncbi:hypothetical protein AnigIFM59636_005577, partial [Aspergillus niger]